MYRLPELLAELNELVLIKFPTQRRKERKDAKARVKSLRARPSLITDTNWSTTLWIAPARPQADSRLR